VSRQTLTRTGFVIDHVRYFSDALKPWIARRERLHEVSLSPSTAGQVGGRTLKLIWETIGQPLRAGLGVWKPYEQLDWPVQETMLTAAAVALACRRCRLQRGRQPLRTGAPTARPRRPAASEPGGVG
jgi:hypothetical protein